MYNKQAMDYAVVQYKGHQYKVGEGLELTMGRVDAEEGSSFDVEDVLLLVQNGDIVVGTPTVKDTKVTFKVLEHTRSEKIPVRRFKSKSRYRRNKSHRQPLSVVTVDKITSGK